MGRVVEVDLKSRSMKLDEEMGCCSNEEQEAVQHSFIYVAALSLR